MIELKLSAGEQDALAELCRHAAAAKHQALCLEQPPTQSQIDSFVESIERFDYINWGTVYDKLHRSGANS